MQAKVEAANNPVALIPRGDWLRYWSMLDADEIDKAVASLGDGWQITDLRKPRSGLALMQLRDGALGDCFYPGEIPWSRAHVSIKDTNGTSGEGAADCMDDRVMHVRNMAILDAVLGSRLDSWERVAALLDKGHQRWVQRKGQRDALLEKTRVEFSRLDATDVQDEDHSNGK